jgi:3-methyladenine DNA glycosylase AlkD
MSKKTTGPSAADIRASLGSEPPGSVPEWRVRRRAWSRALGARPPREIVTAYELIANHPGAIAALTPALIRRLGRGLSDWASVDTFGCYVAGPAWRNGVLPTREVHAWLDSRDRWQRRAAVVCTVALNVRARGGRGDTPRTLAVCRRVVKDRDDMVVKALSWALRSLVEWDPGAVARFLAEHESALAGRVKREVSTKLRTGLKRERP